MATAPAYSCPISHPLHIRHVCSTTLQVAAACMGLCVTAHCQAGMPLLYLSELLGLCAVDAVELAAGQQADARPWSAPATRQRFDPTKYVREQQQRERLLAARFGRRPVTPGVSSRRTSTRSAGHPESATSGEASRLGASSLQPTRGNSLFDITMPGTRPLVLLHCRRTATPHKTFISQPSAGELEGSSAGHDAADAHIVR